MTNRVAIIRREYRVDGGAEQAVNSFLRAYKALGFHVTLVCEKWNEQSEWVDQMVTLKVFGFSRFSRLRSFTRSAEAWIQSNSDILVQAHEWVDGADVLRLGDGLHTYWLDILRKQRSPFGRFFLRLSSFHRFKVRKERQCLQNERLKKIIVNSEFVRQQLEHQYPKVATQAVTITNVCRDFYQLHSIPIRPISGKIILGFVGSGWERKGLRLLLKALSKLSDDFELLVYGVDKASDSFKDVARQLGVIHKICWCGVRENAESIYTEIDCLVISSLYDPCPNVAVEAIVAGVPVIASSETGISDFSSAKAIQIFESGSVEDLVNKINGMRQITDEDRSELRDLSFQFSEANMQYNLNDMLKQLR
mgnify:CR=1 FL=1